MKIKVKSWTGIIALILAPVFSFAQENRAYEKDKLYITITDASLVPRLNEGQKQYQVSNDAASVNTLFNRFGLTGVKKKCDIKTGDEVLDNWYEFTFTGEVELFAKALKELKNPSLKRIEYVPLTTDLYVPNDYNEPASSPSPNTNRALDLIKAPQAWDIRFVNTSTIGTSAESQYQNHVDYVANVAYSQNPMPASVSAAGFHGTAVAGMAGAATNNGMGIASAGGNPRLLLYNSSLHADMNALIDAINRGVKVVTVSANVSIWYSSYWQTVVDYGYNQGVVFVAGAGNGKNWELGNFGTGTCDKKTPGDGLNTRGSGGCMVYPASLAHVISVSAVGHQVDYGVYTYLNEPSIPLLGYYPFMWKDVHETMAGDTTSGYTHNDSVDICAPGYAVPCTYPDPANRYNNCWGTSFAAPMVASAVSLLQSINPCLTPDDITKVIKTSARYIYDIAENYKYLGRLGAGRLDLYQAAKLALTTKVNYVQNTTFSSTILYYFSAAPAIYIGNSVTPALPAGNVTINTGSGVTFYARQLIEVKPGFEAKAGSAFSWTIDQNATFCP